MPFWHNENTRIIFHFLCIESISRYWVLRLVSVVAVNAVLYLTILWIGSFDGHSILLF